MSGYGPGADLPLRDLRNPRAYFRSSNADTLALHSEVADARVTFYNAATCNVTGLPNYVLSASNETLRFYKDDSRVMAEISVGTALDGAADVAQLVVPGGDVRAGRVFAEIGGSKSIVLKDYNRLSATGQFIGFGISCNAGAAGSEGIGYRVASNEAPHQFFVGDAEVARITTSELGAAKVVVGTAGGPVTAALDVWGSGQIRGDLTVSGAININAAASGIATLDPGTARVPVAQLPQSLVYVTSPSNQIDPSLLPLPAAAPVLRGSRFVGIGTTFAYQRLHVQGSAIITDRLGVGIGTAQPAARIHISECNVALPALRLESIGGRVLDVLFSGSNALFVGGAGAGAYPFVGVGTDAPIAAASFVAVGAGARPAALSVAGEITTSGTFSCSNIRTANLELYNAEVSGGANGPVLYTQDLVSGLGPTVRSFIPFQYNREVDVNTLRSHGAAPYVRVQNSSLRVDGDFYLMGAMYTLSDARVKSDLAPIADPLARLSGLRGYTYRVAGGAGGAAAAGLLAQEVAAVLPEAVSEVPGGAGGDGSDGGDRLAVNYSAVVPLLVECIRALEARVADLTLSRP